MSPAAEPLALTGVLASGLPVPLPSDASATYTVPAVFSRRPEPVELDAILAPDLSSALEAAGYPGVDLAVSDRRLLIGGTNLDQLQHGLAEEIATQIDRISREAASEKQRRLDAARVDADDRAARAHDDAALADLVHFVPRSQS